MIDVWFTTGDMAATARFNADEWEIGSFGRLILFSIGKRVAEFDEGVWQYVCQVKSEVIPESNIVSLPSKAKVSPILGR